MSVLLLNGQEVKENVPILMNALNVINLVIGPVIALRMEVVEETEIVIGAEDLALVHLAVVTVVITIVTVTVTVTVIGIGEIEVIVIDVTEIVILIVTVTVIGVIAVTEIVIGIGVIRTRIESVVQPPAHLPLGLIKRIKMINNALNQ